MEDGLGEDLSWFWRAWFFTTAQLDQAVDSVTLADSAGVVVADLPAERGGMPMPVELALTMDDGSTQRLTLPVEIWFGGRPPTRRSCRAAEGESRHRGSRVRYPDMRAGEQPLAKGAGQAEHAQGSLPRSATGR